MRKGKINNLKSNKGITLIALVITIIVLLILAGIAISMLTGENGILNQVIRAKEKTEKKSIEESVQLAIIGAMTNADQNIEEEALRNELKSYFGENGYKMEGNAKDGWTVEVNENSYLIENTGNIMGKGTVADIKGSSKAVEINTVAEDTNGDKIVIPENFNIAENSPTEVEEGIVIEDGRDNQYVWIPVFEKSTSRNWGVDYNDVTNGTDYTKIEESLKAYTATYKDDSYSDVWYEDPNYGYNENGLHNYTNGNLTESDYNELYHNMLKSVYKNGGFYIGRYEMGIKVVTSKEEAQTNSRTSREYKSSNQNEENEKPTIGDAPVSKANAVPYTCITQLQAEMLAEQLGEEADYKNVYTSIMFGVQWDAVCVFIENYDTNNKQSTKSDWLKNNEYGKSWGNYSTSTYTMNRGFYTTKPSAAPVIWNIASTKESESKWLCTTGATDQNSSLNIYDFGGNVGEWTLEKSSNSSLPCVNRGHVFDNSFYASHRDFRNTYFSSSNFSSRSTLYIK